MYVFCGSTVNLSEYQVHQNISGPVSSNYSYSYQQSLTHEPIFSYRKQSKENQLVELISFYMRGKLIVNRLKRLIKFQKHNNLITHRYHHQLQLSTLYSKDLHLCSTKTLNNHLNLLQIDKNHLRLDADNQKLLHQIVNLAL